MEKEEEKKRNGEGSEREKKNLKRIKVMNKKRNIIKYDEGHFVPQINSSPI